MDKDSTCACPEGINCPNPGKHPIDFGWPEMATSDPEAAARWWRPLAVGEKIVDWRPKSNVGLLMGEGHFLLDVDTDGGKTGDLTLGALISHHGADLPHTLLYQTGGGGRQHVMLIPDGTEVRQSISELGDFLDIKGIRSYGIAPPSRSGKGEYIGVIDAPPELPPPWLATWLAGQQQKRAARIAARPKSDTSRPVPEDLSVRARKYIDGALADAVKKVSEAPSKQRNDTLNTQAWSLFSRFGVCGLLDPGEIAAGLKDAAEACGLRGQEVPRTLESAWDGAEDLSGELDDWVFETPSAASGRIPSIVGMVYEFERLYDLRRAVTGEFVSRPAIGNLPPLVSDIGDELAHELRWWWRTEAEAWNRRMAEIVAAAAADPEKKDEKIEGEEYCQVLPAEVTFSTALVHLRTSATRHPRVVRHTRCFDDPERRRIVVDLCDELGQVVEITPDGFEVKDLRSVDGEPWFRKNTTMLTQARPIRPDDVYEALEKARDVLNVDANQWKVILAVLIGAYFSSIVRPGWWLTSPEGAGKTTRGRMIAGWVDPTDYLGGRINLKRDPRDARAKAMGVYVFSIDNLTHMSQDENDFWCTLHTGVSETVRQLHSDNTLLNYSYRRVGLATSLTLPEGLKGDALRRLVHVELPDTDDNLGTETLWKTYAKIAPEVLGALFSVLSGILAHLDEALAADLPGCPEMSDFARRLFAADLAFPRLGGLYEAYKSHITGLLVKVGLEDPFVQLILELLRMPKGNPFEGSPAELLKKLRNVAGADVAQVWFPADVRQIGAKLGPRRKMLRRLGGHRGTRPADEGLRALHHH